MWRTVFLIGVTSLFALFAVEGLAQDVPCIYRPTYVDQPWIHPDLACLEEVINDPAAGELGFTALAVAPDGTLFATRPLAGEVLALIDTDGDLLPDTARVIASGLTLPNGLTYADGALYIVGGSHIYRWQDEMLDILVSDVPSGSGFWTGGIAVRDRIYISTGAPCDFCVPDDPTRGAVLSYALDGSDRRIVATGLRSPADLAFFGDDLYVLDSAPDGLLGTPELDELNRVTDGADFGFPHCTGAVDDDSADCTGVTPPVTTFPTASVPSGLAVYDSDTLPMISDSLLVVLSGSQHDLELRGYMVDAVRFDEAGAHAEIVIPFQMPPAPPYYHEMLSIEEMNYHGSAFFPNRPLDVAVSAEGWVYLSISGGRILALRAHFTPG